MTQKISRIYTGNKGTDHDIEGTFMPPERFREKRNARLLGNKHSGVSSYCEGFTDLGKLPGVSEVVFIKFVMNSAPEQNKSISFDIEIDGTPNSFSLTFNFENSDQGHRAVSDAINEQLNGSNIFASSIGEGVFIWFDNHTSNAVDIDITNIVSDFRYSITSNSGKSDTVHPMCSWSTNKEAIILSVIPTTEAVDETVDTETTTTLCQLWKVTFENDGTIALSKLIYNNYLNYRLWKKPFIQGIIENGCIHRIYLTEGLNPFRSFNVEEDNLFAVSPESSRITPSIIMSPPEVIGMDEGGFLPSGAVQYTYRIFGNNGSVSPIAPFSNMIYLPAGSLSKNSFYMVGDAMQTLSGKTVRLRVDGINVQYERIQVIALYREAESTTTDAEIIYDAPIETGELTLQHSTKGDGVDISIEEIFEENKVWDYAEIMEVHENHMIVADVKSKFAGVNSFDALAKQYDSSGNTYSSRFNPDPSVYKYLPDLIYNTSGANGLRVQGAESDGWEDGNGVRVTYSVDEYRVDGGKPKYNPPQNELMTNQVFVDKHDAHFGVQAKKNGVLTRSIEPSSKDNSRVTDLHYNNHYDGHVNPVMGSELCGYQQGETYRLGIVFSKNGSDIFVKYIGDFVIPDYDEDYIKLTLDYKHEFTAAPDGSLENTFSIGYVKEVYNGFGVNANQYVKSVKMRFDVRIPKEIQEQYDSFKIVRAERKASDRSIFGQGIMSLTVSYANHDVDDREGENNRLNQGEMEKAIGVRSGVRYENTYNSNLPFVQAPDYIFGTDAYTHTSGTKLKLVADLKLYRLVKSKDMIKDAAKENQQNQGFVNFCTYGIRSHDNFVTSSSTEWDVDAGFHCELDDVVNGSAIGSTFNFRNRSRGPIVADNGFSVSGVWRMEPTPGALAKLSAPLNLDFANYQDNRRFDQCLVEFRRELTNQYGGKTDFALENTQWIDTGRTMPISNNQHSFIVGGGDIYTNLVPFTRHNFSPSENRTFHLYSGPNADFEHYNAAIGLAIPCNTLGNYAFTHGEHYGGEEYNWILPAEHEYNTAFHAKNDAKRYVYNRDQFCSDKAFPGLIAVSRNKINGKLVDDWLQFPAFDFYEVNLAHGAITHILSVQGMLFVVQERGIGVLSFDPLAVAQTANGAEIQIINGTGRKIRKLTPLSSSYGSRHKHFRVTAAKADFIIDATNYEILRFDRNGYQAIATKLGYGIWLRNMLKNKGVPDKPLLYEGIHGYYDSEHKEVLIQIDQP